MATPQAILGTDVQPQQTSSATLIHDITSNGASQPFIHREIQLRSRPSTATSNNNHTTGQSAPIGAVSSSIHHGANLILDLIRTERQQVLSDAERQIGHLQQQYNEHRSLYSKEFIEESIKRRDAEHIASFLSTERERYTKEVTEAHNVALLARADVIAAQSTASEAARAADAAGIHLMAVQDALQQVGITISQDDSDTSNKPKIILGTPWLELIPSKIHSSDTPLPDPSNTPDGKPSFSPPIQHLLSSPSNFVVVLKEQIKYLSDNLSATQNSYASLVSQRNQLQSDLRNLGYDRNQLESSKRETEDNAKKLDQRQSEITKLENKILWLKAERDDAVKAKFTALDEMKRTMAESAITLKSTFDQLSQDQQRQAEANAEKDRQALESSLEAKTAQVRELQSQLAHIKAVANEWKGKSDAVAKERDSQKQLQVAELQKYKETSSLRKAQIDDLQKRLEASVSEDVFKANVSRIGELEKELTSLRERHAKSSQEKDEAVALVKSRNTQIKELQDMLAASSNRKLTTESAPKNHSEGSCEGKKARASKSSTPSDQTQFKTPGTHPASTVDRRSKQIPGPKKIEKQKSKSSSSTVLPGSSAERPMEIDSASSTDVEIISGPMPITSRVATAKQKSLRTVLNKAPTGASTIEIVDSVPAEKTNLKRTSDTTDTSTPATKRPRLFLDSSPSYVKDRVTSAASNSPVVTPSGSRSATSSPIIANPAFNFKFRKHSAQASRSVSSGGATSSKKTLANSPTSCIPQSASPSDAASAGVSDAMEDDAHHRSGSIGLETQLAAESTVGAKPRARFLRPGQGNLAASTACETTNSKKQAEFRNFNLSNVPVKEQPSGSSTCSTATSAEQPRSAQAATSATPNREASSSSSGKGRPSLLRQFSSKDDLSTPLSNTLLSSSPSTRSGSAVSRGQSTSSRNSMLKANPPAGTKPKPVPKHIHKGPRSSMAMIQVTLDPSSNAPGDTKSMPATKSSGKVPQGPRATTGVPNTGDLKKGT
ncbi:uncharacterized protein EDB91DRAFT_741063 [Suillus paluster]|uniref:uncharacterized protein n=1 Tax=Suillus paluster TaxID=48578 RepID=UPI001B8668E5|nr:uncharacterized protein EDB91DRAFT_741063 [Suillus paluster]KAG1730807.1 hypothetical protein EDB91DRAFT_741063 [Suillus paluster]